jgi:hypothetical protein
MLFLGNAKYIQISGLTCLLCLIGILVMNTFKINITLYSLEQYSLIDNIVTCGLLVLIMIAMYGICDRYKKSLNSYARVIYIMEKIISAMTIFDTDTCLYLLEHSDSDIDEELLQDNLLNKLNDKNFVDSIKSLVNTLNKYKKMLQTSKEIYEFFTSGKKIKDGNSLKT